MAQEVSGPSSAAAKGHTRFGGGVIATLIGLGLLLIVVVQNREDVNIDFLFWSFAWPLWLFAIAMAVLGAVVWFGAGVIRRHRRRVARRAARG